MRVFVTGGTGHLGTAIAAELLEGGDQVRILARSPRRDARFEWAEGDLATGAGVEAAVAGVDAVVHAATTSPAARRGGFRPLDAVRSPRDVDVHGTRMLVEAAHAAGVEHLVHVSIVGLEHMRLLPYSRVKLEAERIVDAAPMRWSIVRATGFYWLLDRMLERMTRRRMVVLPRDVRMQPVDSDEFARVVAACVTDGGAGVRPEFAGPEGLTMRELAEQYLAARGLERRVRTLPLPRRMAAALGAGGTAPGAVTGEVTWPQWLRSHPQAGAPRGSVRAT